MNNENKSVTLKVVEAKSYDAGRGIARIDPEVAYELGLHTGDVIGIEGTKRTAALVWPGYPEDSSSGLIRIDGTVRRNAGVSIDDRVNIRKIHTAPAEKILFSPTQPLKILGGEAYLAHNLEGRVITRGDVVELNIMGRRLDLVVLSIKPEIDAVVINDKTQAKISEKYVEEIDPEHSYEEFWESTNTAFANDAMDKRVAYGTNIAFASDIPSEKDEIWGELYSVVLSDFITHKDTKPPLVIGINAPWGAGKSSLMRSLQRKIDPYYQQPSSESESTKMTIWNFLKQLREKKKEYINQEPTLPSTPNDRILTIWFNAWKYSKEEQLWAALMQSIIKQLAERMGEVDRERFLLKLNMKRIDIDKIRNDVYQSVLIELLPRLIVFAISSVLTWEYLHKFGSGMLLVEFGAITALASKFWDILNKPLSFKFAEYIKKPHYDEKIGFFGEVEEDFKRVQDLLEDQKLVIFIDDLDRCAPGKIVEVIEAVNVLFGNEHCKCIFVIGIDAEIISLSIECSYSQIVKAIKEKHSNDVKSNFGHQFLQKIIQVSFTLPEPKPNQFEMYLDSIINPPQNSKVGKDFETLKKKIRQEIRRETTDVTDVNKVVQKEAEKVSPNDKSLLDKASRDIAVEMMTEKDPQVQEILKEALNYMEKKPRQLKRFLNIFRLTAILNIRQYGPLSKEDFQRLAKWVVLSMRYPRFIKRVQLNKDDLKKLEEAAYDDAVWSNLKNELEWSEIIDSDLRSILNTGIQLRDAKIDYATLI